MPRKERTGVVTSNKMDKTIVVSVHRKQPHPKYGKFQNQTSKFKAHDEKNECNEGDIVRIVESKPFSKDKCWKLEAIVERVEIVS